MASIIIPPREGRAVRLARGGHVRVVNSEGAQVVDTWAFHPSDPTEFLSMEHSRVATYKILFEVGDCLVTNRRAPILTIVADRSPGIHDTLYAACDALSYPPGHPNCADNLRAALRDFGLTPAVVPCPWNLFEHAAIVGGRYLRDEPSAARAGDYVELRAEMDCILVCSACPSTGYGISGDGPTRGARIDQI
ncbi:MAG: urea carboxylase-associated family protein [Alphaproteobacteria bacterium]|nr:urea carboxylase-associated family protein [Alphaproteobacteria bacterium]